MSSPHERIAHASCSGANPDLLSSPWLKLTAFRIEFWSRTIARHWTAVVIVGAAFTIQQACSEACGGSSLGDVHRKRSRPADADSKAETRWPRADRDRPGSRVSISVWKVRVRRANRRVGWALELTLISAPRYVGLASAEGPVHVAHIARLDRRILSGEGDRPLRRRPRPDRTIPSSPKRSRGLRHAVGQSDPGVEFRLPAWATVRVRLEG
jgi:hypothetical protein